MSQSKKPSIIEDDDFKGPTMVLVGINLGFYVVTSIIGGHFIFTGSLAIILFGFSYYTFIHGLLWTPLTAIFAHASIAHILGNMIFLLIYGFKLEEEGYNDKGIYYAYLITGLLSTLLSGLLIDGISLGASGAIFGLLGVAAGIERRRKSGNYKKVLFASLLLFILSTGTHTNLFAHLLGLIVGMIIGNSDWFDQFHEVSQDKTINREERRWVSN